MALQSPDLHFQGITNFILFSSFVKDNELSSFVRSLVIGKKENFIAIVASFCSSCLSSINADEGQVFD